MAGGDSVGAKENVSGLVKKLLGLALMYDSPENYKTVKMIMEKIQFNSFPRTIVADHC